MSSSDQSALAENIIEIYKKHGQAWTELRGKFLYEKAWLDRFLALVSPYSKILDLGCGSGKPIAHYFIENHHRVTGVDSAEVMIEMANQNFPTETWLLKDMRTLSLEHKFQGIIAWDSFFHLSASDQRKMFSIFHEHGDKGSVLMFSSGPSAGEAIGELFGDALYHASLSQQEYRELLDIYGFDVIHMIADDVECTGHTVWLAKRR